MSLILNPYSFVSVIPFTNTKSTEFDGVDDEIVVPYSSNLQFGKTQAYSVSCWVYAPSYIIASKKILGTGTWATAAYLHNGSYSGGFYSVKYDNIDVDFKVL